MSRTKTAGNSTILLRITRFKVPAIPGFAASHTKAIHWLAVPSHGKYHINMNIINTTRPYVPKPPKQSRIDALRELTRLETTPDLAAQDIDCRTVVSIGGIPTYWSKGLGAETPIYVQHAIGAIKRIHVIDTASNSVAVYDRTANDTWERRAILDRPEEIAASLPKRAINASGVVQPASPKQIATVRKLLEYPADRPMPLLSATAASRIMDRILTEKIVIELAADFRSCLSVPRAVAA